MFKQQLSHKKTGLNSVSESSAQSFVGDLCAVKTFGSENAVLKSLNRKSFSKENLDYFAGNNKVNVAQTKRKCSGTFSSSSDEGDNYYVLRAKRRKQTDITSYFNTVKNSGIKKGKTKDVPSNFSNNYKSSGQLIRKSSTTNSTNENGKKSLSLHELLNKLNGPLNKNCITDAKKITKRKSRLKFSSSSEEEENFQNKNQIAPKSNQNNKPDVLNCITKVQQSNKNDSVHSYQFSSSSEKDENFRNQKQIGPKSNQNCIINVQSNKNDSVRSFSEIDNTNSDCSNVNKKPITFEDILTKLKKQKLESGKINFPRKEFKENLTNNPDALKDSIEIKDGKEDSKSKTCESLCNSQPKDCTSNSFLKSILTGSKKTQSFDENSQILKSSSSASKDTISVQNLEQKTLLYQLKKSNYKTASTKSVFKRKGNFGNDSKVATQSELSVNSQLKSCSTNIVSSQSSNLYLKNDKHKDSRESNGENFDFHQSKNQLKPPIVASKNSQSKNLSKNYITDDLASNSQPKDGIFTKASPQSNMKEICNDFFKYILYANNNIPKEVDNIIETDSQLNTPNNSQSKNSTGSSNLENFTETFSNEKNESQSTPQALEQPSNLFQQILQSIVANEKEETFNKPPQKTPEKYYIKRFKKDSTKIYRLKRFFKPKKPLGEESNLETIFKQLNNNFLDASESNNLMEDQSHNVTTISTPSSFITDDSTSEILSTGSNELTLPQQRLRKGINEVIKNKSLLHCKKTDDSPLEMDKEKIKMKIQEIFFNIVQDFQNNRKMAFELRRQSYQNCVFKDGRLQLKPKEESAVTKVQYNSSKSQTKFCIMLFVLEKVKTLLETDTKLTKREIYYQLKNYIKNQRTVDAAINAVTCMLDCGPWSLNIIAQKGLVYGNLKIILASGEVLNCNIPGTLIPIDINGIVEIQSPTYFILVVEKESIYHKLIEEDLPNRLTRPFIMITGKGFPDLNTQLFLKKLWIIMSLPVFILTDADPHGILIMLNYKFGSVKNAHVSNYLAIPNAKWLGVFPSEILKWNIKKEVLSEREQSLVKHILETPQVKNNPKISEELNILLKKNYKAGIEGLIKNDTYLSEAYLPHKFYLQDFV